MFLSNLSGFSHGVWGNNPSLQVNAPKIGILGKNDAAQDVLGRVSEHFLNAQNKVSLRDHVELQFSSVLEAEPTSLSEVSTEHLKFYAGMLDCYARLNSITERVLTEYRDQITAFDQTIQAYQDMLDGKTALPDNMTTEQVQAMLDLVKETRDQFVQNGAKEVNRYLSSSNDFADDKLFNKITSSVLGESFDYAGKGADFWRIDPNAEDIYGEIDRTLGALSSLTQTCRRGIATIAAELERRGYSDSPYMAHFRQWYQQTKPIQTRYVLSELLEHTWSEFRDKSRDIYKEN